MSLPSIVYVREEKLTNGTTDLYVYDNAEDCIDADGPSVVGTYKLVGKRTLRKVIQETKK